MRRRDFIQKTGAMTIGGIVIPSIVPASVMGKNAPSNRINIGMIGTGRQAINVNLKDGFLKLDNCRVIAVNDVDSWRMNCAKDLVNESYSAKKGGKYNGVKSYDDYRDLLDNKDIDAVMISTTDHWHAPIGIAAAKAKKHISIEKALSVCYSHSKALSEAVKVNNVSNRLDSEFRSNEYFRKAVEIVRNNQIGTVKNVIVGVPAPLNGSAIGPQPVMKIPQELNYDMWLGPAFEAPYTVKRVHDPKEINTRPGWMRIEDYCNGMITNWGAHLWDIALWGINKEYELPVSVNGDGTFSSGLWNTINSFDIEYKYADGLMINFIIDKPYVKFIGENGWVKISYPNKLEASNEEIVNYKLGEGDISFSDTLSDKEDFLKAIETNSQSLEPIEVGHNVFATTSFGLISVKLQREIHWDNSTEKFIDDTAANAMLNCPFRGKWIDKDVIDWMNKYQKVDL
uniref:Gfo/Idh/MocA family protein n=1 Tax=uncultured Draconibacterium sp. TaxID=1573823 RepID=UPI00321702FC